MKTDGSYSIEGAITITVFTICMMALLSLFSIIKVECEVQDALNETALELSQYSYTTGMENPVPAVVLVDQNFHRSASRSWLREQGVTGFYPILQAEQDIWKLQVNYQVKVNTYGLFRKVLPISQSAVIHAMLPEDLRALYEGTGLSGADSIWKKPPFQRGRYFIGNLRSGRSSSAVKPGQGIDLYSPATGGMTEHFSMNLFNPYYSISSGDAKNPNSYTPKRESIERELINYGRDFTKDVKNLNGSVEMKDGTRKPVKHGPKKMIVTVPLEARENESMQRILQEVAEAVRKAYGISIEVHYEEEALI